MKNYPMLEQLSLQYGTGFYFFYSEQLEQNYMELSQAFSSRYPHVQFGYSYKTNYLPYLCQQMDQLGAHAEVVSHLEYKLALELGVDPQKIIFNGPLKTYEDITLALDNESTVNLDSWHEIAHLKRYCHERPGKKVKIGLRVNFDLRQGGENPLTNGFPVSRFGFCVENNNFAKALEEIRTIPEVIVNGLHGHFSTNRSVAVYRHITKTLSRLAKQFMLEQIEYIDIGGGLYGKLPEHFPVANPPTFDDYAEAICGTMLEEWGDTGKYPTLIVEPGICLTANTCEYVCKVIDVKENSGEIFVLVDGSMYTIKPTMHRFALPFQLVRADPASRRETKRYHIVGYTCMEKDYLIENHVGELPQPGDYLVFAQVGAYTTVFQPPFIRERPPIIAVERHQFTTARERETFAQFFDGHPQLFPFPFYLER